MVCVGVETAAQQRLAIFLCWVLQNDAKTEITEREIKETVLKLAEKARSKFKSMSDMFKKFDVNRDGSLSFDDFNAVSSGIEGCPGRPP